MKRRFAFAFLQVLIFGGMSLAAQQASQPAEPNQPQSSPKPGDFVLQVNTQLVDLDVVVTDKSGNTVNNLTRDDFDVFENKRPQTIVNFDRPQTHALPSEMPISSTRELDKLAPEAPVSIIVLDEINTRFEDEVFARYSLDKYLKTQNNMLSQPTMLVAVTLQHFIVLHDYTTNRKDILDALDHHFIAYPWHLQGSFQNEQISQAFASLRQLAQATIGHRGHKNMIWIGRGFPSIHTENLLPTDNDILQTAIETCTNMLRDARITLYTVDPAGVSSAPPSEDDAGFSNDDPFGGELNFNGLARATGGQTFFNRNDVDHMIGKSVRDGSEFYTLSYRPSTETNDLAKFRNIKIVMKDHNLTATTREGYYNLQGAPMPALASDKSAQAEQSGLMAFDITAAASSMLVYDGLPITVTRSTTNPDNFLIHVAASGLNWTSDGTSPPAVEIALVVSSFDRKGRQLHQYARMLKLHQKTISTGAPAQLSLDLQTKIDTTAPAARIRFVVRAADGKLGADNAFLVDRKTLADPSTVFTPPLQGRHH